MFHQKEWNRYSKTVLHCRLWKGLSTKPCSHADLHSTVEGCSSVPPAGMEGRRKNSNHHCIIRKRLSTCKSALHCHGVQRCSTNRNVANTPLHHCTRKGRQQSRALIQICTPPSRGAAMFHQREWMGPTPVTPQGMTRLK